WTVGPDPLTIVGSPDGSQRCEVINLGLSSTDSSNCPIAGSIPFTWMSSNGLSGSGTIFFSAPATPPCVNCEQPAPAGAVDEGPGPHGPGPSSYPPKSSRGSAQYVVTSTGRLRSAERLAPGRHLPPRRVRPLGHDTGRVDVQVGGVVVRL